MLNSSQHCCLLWTATPCHHPREQIACRHLAAASRHHIEHRRPASEAKDGTQKNALILSNGLVNFIFKYVKKLLIDTINTERVWRTGLFFLITTVRLIKDEYLFNWSWLNPIMFQTFFFFYIVYLYVSFVNILIVHKYANSIKGFWKEITEMFFYRIWMKQFQLLFSEWLP